MTRRMGIKTQVDLRDLTMSKTYAQIQKQIEALQRDAEKLKRQEVGGVIARIKEAIKVYGLTASDLGLNSKRGRKGGATGKSAGSKPPSKSRDVKYRNEAGNTWGGRGPRPQWLREALAAGKSLQDFAI